MKRNNTDWVCRKPDVCACPECILNDQAEIAYQAYLDSLPEVHFVEWHLLPERLKQAWCDVVKRLKEELV